MFISVPMVNNYSRIGVSLGDYLPQLETLVLTYNNIEELVRVKLLIVIKLFRPFIVNIQTDLDPLASIASLRNLR